MMSTRKRLAAVLGVVGMLAIGAPMESASAVVDPGSCGDSTEWGQGDIGSSGSTVCQGSGLVFVAPSVGQVATVIGPTVIGPADIGTVVVSPGNVVAG